MSKQIDGVPESISRDDWLAMICAVGFEPEILRELYFAPDGVHAVVFDVDENGAIRRDGDEAATHRVHIPCDDGLDEK